MRSNHGAVGELDPHSWWIVRVCANREMRVVRALERDGFSACAPTYRPPNRRPRPMFRGAVFVRSTEAIRRPLDLLATSGVVELWRDTSLPDPLVKFLLDLDERGGVAEVSAGGRPGATGYEGERAAVNYEFVQDNDGYGRHGLRVAFLGTCWLQQHIAPMLP